MKKVLFVILIGLSSLTASAQKPVSAGVHAKLSGYSLTEPTREYVTSFKPGFEFGAFARMDLTKYFFFQPEFGFSYIGGAIKPEFKNEISYQNAAIQIPLLVGITFSPSRDAGFRFYAGLGNSISILNNISVINKTLDEYPPIDISSGLKSSAYEISGVLGVAFYINDLSIDLRYGRGFNSAITRKNPDTGATDSFYQNTFTLGFSYRMIKPSTASSY